MIAFSIEDLIKVLLAVLIGGIIGLERELNSKAAGLRTITLITVGSTIFTIISEKIGDPSTSRIAANVVTGIGFLGAGVILFTEGKLKGLTTASSIWVAAALGMAVGGGDYPLALAATIVVIIVLTSFSMLDRLLDRFSREIRSYEINFAGGDRKRFELEGLFREKNLQIRNRRPMKMDGRMMVIWDLDGQQRFHQSLVEDLMADGEILLLKY